MADTADVRTLISQLPEQRRKAAAARSLREVAVDFATSLRQPGSGASAVDLEVALYLAALDFAREAAPTRGIEPMRITEEEDRLG